MTPALPAPPHHPATSHLGRPDASAEDSSVWPARAQIPRPPRVPEAVVAPTHAASVMPPPYPPVPLPSAQPPVPGRTEWLPGDEVEVKDLVARSVPVEQWKDRLRQVGDVEDWLPGTVASTAPMTVRPRGWQRAFEWHSVRDVPGRRPSRFLPPTADAAEGHAELLELRARSAAHVAQSAHALRVTELQHAEHAGRRRIECLLAPSWSALAGELDAQFIESREWEDTLPGRVARPTAELSAQRGYWRGLGVDVPDGPPPPPPPPPAPPWLTVLRGELSELEREQAAFDKEEAERRRASELERSRRRSTRASLSVSRRDSALHDEYHDGRRDE